MRPTIVAALLAVSACQQPPDEHAADIKELEGRVSEVERLLNESLQEKERLTNSAQPPAEPKATYQLLVIKGDATFTHDYSNLGDCERAKEALFVEAERRNAEAQSRVGTVNAAGARVIAVGAVAAPDATCIPA